MPITDELLCEQGFHKFAPGPLDNERVETMFQKRYDDEEGIKYFITIRKWGSATHPYTGDLIPVCYEGNVQLYGNGDKTDALDLLFHSSWELEDIERYLEMMWNTGLFEYYERF